MWVNAGNALSPKTTSGYNSEVDLPTPDSAANEVMRYTDQNAALSKAIEDLANRLMPVLSPEGPSQGQSAQSVKPTVAPIVATLREQNDRLAFAVQCIEMLASRVRL